MIKQTLTFQSPALLSLRNKQLVIAFKEIDEEVTRPIEDIGIVIIENAMVKVTIPLLIELSNNNVAVVFCDQKAMPKSMLMSLDGNNTLQESHSFQLKVTTTLKKKLWKQIIETKIRNQSLLLHKLNLEGDLLKPYYLNVKSGDTTNREGLAAKIYWKLLFGKNFNRSRDGDVPNNLLNYGYSILRAATARALIGSGLYPAFGLFHRNRYNAFPLADDIMEPYRPFVDELVYRLYYDAAYSDLTPKTKMELQRILFCDVCMGKIMRPLEVALSFTTASLARVYKDNNEKIILPKLII